MNIHAFDNKSQSSCTKCHLTQYSMHLLRPHSLVPALLDQEYREY